MNIFVEKYRPSKITEMILDESISNMLTAYVSKGSIPNILLFGNAGIGKTSLAKVLAKELNACVLYINASEENGIDTIRNKVLDFSQSVAPEERLKIVILDEADGLTSAAQNSLRNIIETCSDDTRFIFTCNFLDRIIDPIQSRCTPITIKFSIKDVLKKILFILESEKINFEKNKLVIPKILKKYFPDIRRIISVLEQLSVTGELVDRDIDSENSVEQVASYILTNKTTDIRSLREYWIKNEDLFSKDYILLAGTIFDKLQTENEMYVAAQHIYQMNNVLDKEIEFTALVIALKKF